MLNYVFAITLDQFNASMVNIRINIFFKKCMQKCSLTFSDTMIRWQEPLLHQTLKHGAHRRPVNQLQHEQMRLREKRNRKWILTHIKLLLVRLFVIKQPFSEGNVRCESLYLHSSRPWQLFGWCCVPAGTLASGKGVCGRSCCPRARWWEAWRWHSPAPMPAS